MCEYCRKNEKELERRYHTTPSIELKKQQLEYLDRIKLETKKSLLKRIAKGGEIK